ncbi:PfkB family carbohydrate kinase [Streptomyces sp. NPDC059456]|uniref:PfkB family carbohydrate kinase n=1 Tax=Streptomyces sp. NPDC059456 TaxID=3346838 RepID=UPI0036C6ED19
MSSIKRNSMTGRPVLVGTVTLDFLHEGPLGRGQDPATVRWGGVANNAACALAARGARPALATVAYTGELGPAVGGHLAGNGVEWLRLPERAPLPVFHAELVEGSVADKRFLGERALGLITPGLLDRSRGLFEDAGVLAAGTDAEEPGLAWLADAAAARGLPFWLLSADPNEVSKLRPLGRGADLVALNLRELSLWAGRPPRTREELVAAARRLPAPGGHCLVTLGADGALLVPADGSAPVHQPAVSLAGEVITVGAGDVLFGCLLAGRLAGLDWAPALAEATVLTSRFLGAPEDAAHPYEVLADPARA